MLAVFTIAVGAISVLCAIRALAGRTICAVTASWSIEKISLEAMVLDMGLTRCLTELGITGVIMANLYEFTFFSVSEILLCNQYKKIINIYSIMSLSDFKFFSCEDSD